MKYFVKNWMLKMTQFFGYDIKRLNASNNSSVQLLSILNRLNIGLVFDVGANTGQFARELISIGYKGRIVSLEPLMKAHTQLCKSAKGFDLWEVHSRVAVGDFDGETKINVSQNSVSSSVLPMLSSHSSVARNSAYVGVEVVSMCRLDSIIEQYLNGAESYFIKIDTQGFESQVLDGAKESLKNAGGLLCELSLTPLYEGQLLWLEMIEKIKGFGFSLWALRQGFTDEDSGRTLQVDGFFCKSIDEAQ